MSLDPAHRPRGRRHNGLDAASYAPVGDVDPRVGEHLLDVLYLYGIAAYLQPSVDLDAALRHAHLPATPAERLWVDRLRTTEARELVEAEAAEAGASPGSSGEPAADEEATAEPVLADRDEEQAWLEIVASFDRDVTGPVPPWPVDEDDPDAARDRAGAVGRDAAAADTEPAPEAEPADYFNPRIDDPAYDPEPDPEDNFVPPPPPPLPSLTKATAAALLTILFGVLLLFWPGLLALGAELSFALGILAIIGGMAVLIWRMHDTRAGDDGPDDGAVV